MKALLKKILTRKKRLITICAWCNLVRNNKTQTWHKATDKQAKIDKKHVTHGLCPDCAKTLRHEGMQ